MDEIVEKLVKRQEALEVKNEEQIKNIQAVFTQEQNINDQKNEKRFVGIEKQISQLNDAINKFPNWLFTDV